MRSQDKRERSRRLTDESSGNTKLRRAKERRILKGEARDKTESWREKTRKREDAKKGNFRGEEEETEKAWASSEEGKDGPCAANSHLGDSRMVTNPIQSNPSHLPQHMGNPFSSFHIPPETLSTSLAQLLAANRRVERASLGSPNDNFKEDWNGAATKALNAGLLWPRSRVFVIIPPVSIFGCFNLLSASHLASLS